MMGGKRNDVSIVCFDIEKALKMINCDGSRDLKKSEGLLFWERQDYLGGAS
jgi:hypothetical protein